MIPMLLSFPKAADKLNITDKTPTKEATYRNNPKRRRNHLVFPPRSISAAPRQPFLYGNNSAQLGFLGRYSKLINKTRTAICFFSIILIILYGFGAMMELLI
jgi:hypothetical protein